MVRRCLAAVLLAFPAAAANAAQPPRNVLLVVLDDLGTEKLSFYGQSAVCPPTPHLDQLRAEGVLFTNAYVQPLCAPTRAALQTGRYAFRTGTGDNPTPAYTLSHAEVTLAEMLKAGLPADPPECGLFGKWQMSGSGDPLDSILQGYDLFQGPKHKENDHFSWVRATADAWSVVEEPIGSPDGPFNTSTFAASVAGADALAWINSRSGPFFACVAFRPPHGPWQVPPLSLLSESTKAQVKALGFKAGDDLTGTPYMANAYDWLIEAADAEIGRLIDGLDPDKAANTHVLVIGDNGTPDHLVTWPAIPEHAKKTVYRQCTRVPLLVAGPLAVLPNSTCTALVSAVDVWATVADLMGADLSLLALPGPSDSISFAKAIFAPAADGKRGYAFSQWFEPNGAYVPDPQEKPPGLTGHHRAITDGTFRYLRLLDPATGKYQHELYFLKDDPDELLNLYPAYKAGLLPKGKAKKVKKLIKQMAKLSGK